MSTEITREKLGWIVRLENGLVMNVMDGRNDPLHGHVEEANPMARSIAFDRQPPSSRAELHALAEALRQIENDEMVAKPRAEATSTDARTAPDRRLDERKTDICPVCGAHGTQPCSTVSERDHKARALGWPTSRRPRG